MDDQHDEDQEPTVLAHGRVRIVGAEPAASVMRGDAEAEGPSAPAEEAAPDEEPAAHEIGGTELPHWTEAPTGEVPAVLARGSDEEGDEADPWSSVPGPTWREEHADWEAHEETFEPAMLAHDDERPGSLDESAEPGDRQPWSFELPATPSAATPPVAPEERQAADDDTLVVPAVRRHEVVEEVAFHIQESEGPAEGAPVAGAEGEQAPGAAEVPARRPAARRGLGHGLRLTHLRHATSELAEEPASKEEAGEEGEGAGGLAATAAEGATARPTHAPHRGHRRPPAAKRVPVVNGASPRTGTGAPWPGAVARPAPESRGGERNLAVAAVSGLVLGAIALVFFKMGTVTSMIVITAVLVLAAMEAYAAFRRAGYHPVTLFGLVATVSVLVATYQKGQEAIPLVVVLLFAFTMLWQLTGVDRAAEPIRSLASTLLVFCWIGVFGSYAALLLDPTLFPNRHGIAFVLGGLIAAVAYDVGALIVGRWLGRRPLSAASPNKTWEGVAGGGVAAVVVSVALVHLIHPWTVAAAAALGVAVAVVSPIGDLSESLVKRQLGLKDMGRILPGHGGLVDRIDGILFVMPATFYLVKAFHLG